MEEDALKAFENEVGRRFVTLYIETSGNTARDGMS
jgi:hypothetical protein